MVRRTLLPLAVIGALAWAGCQDSTPLDTQNPQQDQNDPSSIVQEAPHDGAAPPAGTLTFEEVPGRYIVLMQENTTEADLNAVVTQTMGLQKPAANSVFHTAVKGFVAPSLSSADVTRLRNDTRIRLVEPDVKINATLPYYTFTGNRNEVQPWGVTRVGGTRNGTGKTAWILDTGIDLNNSDLNVDRTRSRVFAADGNSSVQDMRGHGTHVAGTIGARINGRGVVGVAPNARLVSLRVFANSGAGYTSWIISALDYVAANASAGDVVNMSLGSSPSSSVDAAVRRVADRGIKVVVSAGNSSANASTQSPARVNHANVYTVSASDRSDYFASFSNYGNPPVDYAAPGVYVLSTHLNGRLAYMSGTSMAAPHVTGLLLNGAIRSGGDVINDRDSDPDPIASR